jgi:hypothetical protein
VMGGKGSDFYNEFISLCVSAHRILKEYGTLFVSLFSIVCWEARHWVDGGAGGWRVLGRQGTRTAGQWWMAGQWVDGGAASGRLALRGAGKRDDKGDRG